jgi:hypothetical protein
MARPKSSDLSKKSEAVKVRLTMAERAQLQAKADEASTTVTAFLRASALGAEVKVTRSTAPDFAVRDELRRIGVNLNQIAKAMNARKDVPPAQLVALCAKLDTLFDTWLVPDGSQSRQSRP